MDQDNMGKEQSKPLDEELANKPSEREYEKPVRDGNENKKAARKKPEPNQLGSQNTVPEDLSNECSVNKRAGQQQKKHKKKEQKKPADQNPNQNPNQNQKETQKAAPEKIVGTNSNQRQKETQKAAPEKSIGQNSNQQQKNKKKATSEKNSSQNLEQKQKQKKKKAVQKNPVPVKETITHLKGFPNGPSSFVMLIGAMKCGTTSLYSSLANHPVICPCIEKEPGYFTSLDLPLSDYGEDTFQQYQSLWPMWDSNVHKFAIEASTSYSKCPDFPNAAQRINRLKKLTGSQFKFIYVIRDPVALATSFYRHAMTDIHWGKHTVKKLLADGQLARGLRVICSYAKQLEFYHNNFDRDSILIVHFEDMVHRSESTLAEIYRFLDLEVGAALEPSLIHTHSSKKRVADFFENHSEHVYPGLTPEKMLTWKLSDDHKTQIRNWLKDDICVLKDKYDVDTSHWTY